MGTVSNGDRKDTDMKLLLICTAILALSLAEAEKRKAEAFDDSEAEASATIELLKEGADLNTAASSYNTYIPPSQRPPQWNQPNKIPVQNWYPQKEETKPIQPVQTSVPANVQSDYYDHHHHHQWNPPTYHPPTTTTPVSVIKNEQYFGDNGYYKYEYKIADGTHVSEEGYYTDPKQSEESLVKRGWYSFRGADGKTYTVSYWADKTGFHAYGDHLPTPPPPKTPQGGFNQNKPLHDYPTQTTPAPVYYPTQPPKPQQPTYVPTQKPIYVEQPAYVPSQQPTYQPPQPSYDQVYYPPQQQTYYPPQQQQYYPPQQNY